MVPSLGTIIFIAAIILAMIRITREYERGVVFRLGRFLEVKGPGLFLIIPFVDTMERVDLRIVTMDVPTQEVITRDNVTIRVNAVVFFKVMNPKDAVIEVENFGYAINQFSQTTLRSIVGQAILDEVLAHREKINSELQKIIDKYTDAWGIKVTNVEIKDVELPSEMKRAMAREAEAERERRAKIISAEGEFQAAQKLSDASNIISQSPSALQLRYLQTLTEISTENASTIIFPIPVDMIQGFINNSKNK
jgi:regulator of protease activity HflC (stomatin/prohibitin superfamily)